MVPIPYNIQTEDELNFILDRVNGVLMPGGDARYRSIIFFLKKKLDYILHINYISAKCIVFNKK